MEAKKGFSLIETLAVIGILFILVGFVLVITNSFQREKVLDAGVEEIINSLRLAQSKTLASEGNSSYGIYFESDRFTLFNGAFFDAASPDNEVHQFSSNLIISQINLTDGTSSVAFQRLTGYASADGTIKVEMASDASQNKIIYIDSSGTVNLASASVDDSDRIKDSRHVHVLYSQDTKIAITLTLFFPADGYTESIDYQTFLNAGKTEFSWEGTITVGGVGQKLKIHTHDLSGISTLFCIHRDQRYNTKAAVISLDGQNLINYTASGETNQGTSFWAGAPDLQ
jgi:type II secretory pathway pseudopilin PulG